MKTVFIEIASRPAHPLRFLMTVIFLQIFFFPFKGENVYLFSLF